MPDRKFIRFEEALSKETIDLIREAMESQVSKEEFKEFMKRKLIEKSL